MPADPDPVALTLVIPGEALAVRAALRALFETLPLKALPEATRGTAQVVLAEALNNVVEHAYAEKHGDIEITLEAAPGGLACLIVDHGCPMPAGSLPGASPPAADPMDPPEGGFGWYLIRSLSEDLRYSRDGNCNHLSFRLSAG
ncbi:MAG: ATP-binding protein [Gemmobacter sp.]